MVRFFAVAGNSCLAIRSLAVFLTMFWLMKVRSLSTFESREVSESYPKARVEGRGRPAKQRMRRRCRSL